MLTCTARHGVDGAQLENPAQRTRLARPQRRRDLSKAGKSAQLPQRRNTRLGSNKASQAMLQQYRTSGQRAVVKIETDDPLAIGQQPMLDTMLADFDRTVHGFRSLASTVLNESGLFEPGWIEMQLAHQP